MNVYFIECIVTPAFDDLMSLYLYVPRDFYLSVLNISVTKREKKIVEEWVRNAKQIKREKQQQKQNTKSRTPKTSHIVRKIIWERKNNTETWEKEKTYMYCSNYDKWSRKLDFTLSINIHVWYKNFSQTLTFSLFLKRK